MNRITATVAAMLAMMPLRIESLPRSGPTVRSSITFSLTGSLPLASEIARCVGALHREIAADLGAPAQDRLIDVGRRQDFVVEDDRERLVDVLLRNPAEAARARRIERNLYDRPSVLIEALLGVGEQIARDDHSAFHRDEARAIGARQSLASGRCAALGYLGRIGGKIDQLELETGRLPYQLLQGFGIFDAGHLHEDAPLALIDDRDFLRALRIDPPPDDVAGDRHCVACSA